MSNPTFLYQTSTLGLATWIYVVGIAVLFLGIGIGYFIQGTGFGTYTYSKASDTEDYQRYKTLWDWLQLLIVPAALAVGGLWLASVQEERQRQIEIRQEELAARRERAAERAAEQRAQDVMLLSYLDQMSSLDLQDAGRNDYESSVASARTITVLRGLDAERKRLVLRFVYEAHLIRRDEFVVDLASAPLTRADLSAALLENAELSKLHLTDANLSYAKLHGADLSETDLTGANLSGADLSGASLAGTNLTGADLTGTNLEGAKVSQDQLDQCGSLAMATLPDGSKHLHGGPPNRALHPPPAG